MRRPHGLPGGTSDGDEEPASIRERELDDPRRRAAAPGSGDGAADADADEREPGTSPPEPVRVRVRVRSRESPRALVEGGVGPVDVHADRCGPCRMLEPIVGSLARTTPATVA